ncbi:MAG: PqqD family protein [Motilibacteraceae bacterium]
MTPVEPASVLQHAPGLVVEVLGGELVVWEPAAGQLHRLDGPAALTFELLDGSEPLERTAEVIAAALEADPAQVRSDVLGLARHLVGLGLVRPVSPAGTVAGVTEGDVLQPPQDA